MVIYPLSIGLKKDISHLLEAAPFLALPLCPCKRNLTGASAPQDVADLGSSEQPDLS